MITLPKNWQTYYNAIIERSRRLIKFNIWQGITSEELSIWLKNFHNDEEKFFSACLLDSLIYRSKAQTLSLIYDLLNRVIPNKLFFNQKKLYEKVDFPMCMNKYDDPYIRLVSVRRAGDPPSKSSAEILRYMKNKFGVNSKWMIEISEVKKEISNGVEAFIFIDDFLGTGEQFCKMFSAEYSSLLDYSYFLYSPLVAHENGIDAINRHVKNVEVCSVEYLSSKNSFFVNYFNDTYNKETDGKKFYENMLNDRAFAISSSEMYGYGDLELSYGFEHGTPDNTLPVFSYSDTDWKPLIK
ncbi:phosphoribosyltransferase-like protein [Spirosoma gilvum]